MTDSDLGGLALDAEPNGAEAAATAPEERPAVSSDGAHSGAEYPVDEPTPQQAVEPEDHAGPSSEAGTRRDPDGAVAAPPSSAEPELDDSDLKALGISLPEVLDALSLPTDADGQKTLELVSGHVDDLRREEEDRQKLIEGKASGLIQVSGGTLALVASVGGLIVKEAGQWESGWVGWTMVVTYLAALAAALTALVFGVVALKVTTYQGTLSLKELFGPYIRKSAAEFQRYIVAHAVRLYAATVPRNDRKATRVRQGQVCYMICTVMLLMFAASLSYSVTAHLLLTRRPPHAAVTRRSDAVVTAAAKGTVRDRTPRAHAGSRSPAAAPPASSADRSAGARDVAHRRR